MNPAPVEAIRLVARQLRPLRINFAFLGGAVVQLLVDDPGLLSFRPTQDVDILVEVVGRMEFSQLEQQLRFTGFRNDTSEGAPICRWKLGNCTVDIMPTEEAILGMKSRWFKEALASAGLRSVGEGVEAPIVSAPLFLATKMEAFKDRGKEDFHASVDLEDIITVVDGCSTIAEQASRCDEPIRRYLSARFSHLLQKRPFLDSLSGHLLPDSANQARVPIILARLRQLAGMADTSQ